MIGMIGDVPRSPKIVMRMADRNTTEIGSPQRILDCQMATITPVPYHNQAEKRASKQEDGIHNTIVARF